LDDIQDRLSENELASFFQDLADTAGRIALTHCRSDIDFERKQEQMKNRAAKDATNQTALVHGYGKDTSSSRRDLTKT
jgi:hypothetical protein